MQTRVRFAPSPTGQIHIGNIRVAIFNWLFARHSQGIFLLRIEDTDLERSTPEAVTLLLQELEWLGLNYDEPIKFQSACRDYHLQLAHQLLTAGKAYKYKKGEGDEAILFRIPWDVNSGIPIRDRGMTTLTLNPTKPVRISINGISYNEINKKGNSVAVEACLSGFRQLVIRDDKGSSLFELEPMIGEITAGKNEMIIENAINMTFLRREVWFHDLIKGEMSKALDNMKDLVIVRSDQSPVFHLANVGDDITQQITHIIRGDDHIENTFRHLLLFQALNSAIPAYAHLPMICNNQGKPYSKRDGAAYIGELRDRGFLPDAVFNYLSLLGWSPGNDLEKMTRKQMISLFSLDRVQSSSAQMDMAKMTNLNGLYIAEIPFPQFLRMVTDIITKLNWGKSVDPEYLEKVASLMQSRTKLLGHIEDWQYFFIDNLNYNRSDTDKHLKSPTIKEALQNLKEFFVDLDFNLITIEQAIHAVTESLSMKPGKLNFPLRLALTASSTGAGIYELILVLGKSRVIKRLDYAIHHLC